MKKKIAAVLLAAVLACSAAGCKSKIKTEIPMTGIKAMMCTGEGDIFLLSDLGLRRYSLSSDKELVYIYDNDDIVNSELDIFKDGDDIVYSNFYADRLLPSGDTGVVMFGKYMSNSLGRSEDLFVIQDAADLNYAAAYFTPMDKSGDDFLNGASIDDNGIYFKLNSKIENGDGYEVGIKYHYTGQVMPYSMPDGVTGSIPKSDSEDGESWFLVETKSVVEITDGDEVLKSYERSKVADAFVDGGSVYVLYKSGKVTVTDVSGAETDFMTLNGSVSKANDTFIYDGVLYWFDSEGVKTGK